YTHLGTNPKFWGQTTTSGTGRLLFSGAPKTIDLTLVVSNAPIISCNVEINLNAPGDLFILNPATNTSLWIARTLTLTQGTIQLGDAVTARNLTLWGSNFIIGANGSINTVGIGTLFLDSSAPPLNVYLGGNRDLGNVTVDNDVVLDPASPGLALGVTGLFRHRNGEFNFNTRNITIKPTGNYTRTGGTYAATTGYLIIQTPLFNQGTTDFSIPNLRIQVGAAFAVANSAYITVLNTFDLFNGPANVFTHTFGGVPRLKIADGATVRYQDGNLDVMPTYMGSIDLFSVHIANIGLPANIWPGTPTTLVNHFNSWGTAGTTVTLPGTRNVNTKLTLTSGTTSVPGGANLHIEDNSEIHVVRGVLNVLGTRTFGNDIDVFYKNDGVGVYNTGAELPSMVNDLTFTRNVNAINQFTIINTPVMVNGTLTIRNNVQTQATPAVPTNATISTYGDVVIENESASFGLATDPVTVFNAPLEFRGGVDQDLIVPAAGVDLTNGGAAAASIRINKDNPTDVVNLVGGNLITGTVFFVNGLLVTGDNILTIPAPVPGGGQGFNRAGVTGSNASHVIGRVRKVLVNGGTIATSTNERSEFPVGTNPKYRPTAITFKPAYGFPTIPNALAITVSHVDDRPTGTIGLPIEDGVSPGVDVVDYPDFHWQIWTNQNLSQYTFDLELRADGFADYDTVSNLRIIRRHGDLNDVANEWRLQGSIEDYDNAQYQGDPSKPVVINQNSLGGLRTEGALFTLGLKSAKQEFYSPVWLPGNPFRAMTIFCTRADIGGIPIGMGDEIGVYDGELCVGAAVLNGPTSLVDPIQIICSAKEDGLDNGFTDGNAITFRMWDVSAGIEYNTAVQFYDPGSGTPITPVPFEGLGTAVVQLDDDGINAEPQGITLSEGWNMFSIGVVPNNGPDMLDILNPILGDLDKVLDETGNSIVNLFGTWQNSIGDWSQTEGYYIKMKNSTTLNVEGTPVSVPLCINLTSGWNIISYPCITYDQNALAVFQPLIDNTELIKVVDEAGNSIFKLFGTWLNSIGDMTPGEAYYVKVNTNTQICIDCPGQSAMPKMVDDMKAVEPVHFSTPLTGNPYQPMTVYIVESTIDGEPLVAGDEIAIYDGGACVGVAVVDAAISERTPLEIIAAKNDGNGLGFKDGNPMSLKIWKKATNEEFVVEATDIQFLTLDDAKLQSENRFEALGTAAIAVNASESLTSGSLVPEDFQMDQNYPNPFNPTTMISYALPEDAHVTLEIYNLNGNLVKSLYSGERTKGRHVVEWDGLNDVGMKVASGIYIYKMRAGNFVSTKKMVLSK
ncbi:MAG: FlgD immunoglobulin-like domain containing protein, partial [candidate division KSB1 bacterium]|nr:FlgD immunoglobulin-like domain containing protein [candidate division KSB1 bacterium]